MSKLFDSSSQESLGTDAKRAVVLPEVDSMLMELQEASEAELPIGPVPGDVQVNAALERLESTPDPKIRKGSGEYLQVKLVESSKVLLPKDSSSDARSDSYRRIRTRLMQQRAKREFHVAGITSSVQGEGKTLTAINLALCCSQLPDFKVLLLDADFRTRGCSEVLGIEHRPGLAEVLTSAATCCEAIARTDQAHLYLMAAGDAKLPAPELFAGSAWSEFVAWAGQQFDLVIVDAPPVLPVPDFELIGAACQRVIVVARPFVTRDDQLERTMARIEGSKFAGVVLNGSNLTTREYYYEYANRSHPSSKSTKIGDSRFIAPSGKTKAAAAKQS